MPTRTRSILPTILICALLVQAAQSCQAEPRRQAALTGLGPNSKTTLVVATLVTAVALIGFGVYFGIRHAHMLKGCVADGPDGLELQTQDSQNLHLLGATSNLKPGNRVKVSGSKKKTVKGISDRPSFVVEKLDKVYGACSTAGPRS